MEAKVIEKTGPRDLTDRATRLAAAVESLPTIFEQEAILLRRKEEVARLAAVRSVVVERLRRATDLEAVAEMGHNMADGVGSVVRLVTGLVTMASPDTVIQAISHELLAGPSPTETPFGTVLVCVGQGGVPDGVDIVNISEMARQSERDERAVMSELMAQGNLLCGGEAFFQLIDMLSGCILQGELSLPVSPQRLYTLGEQRPLQLGSGSETE